VSLLGLLIIQTMKYVIVNGRVAVEDGKYTGVLAATPFGKTRLIRLASD
jgi:hypothetical protein